MKKFAFLASIIFSTFAGHAFASDNAKIFGDDFQYNYANYDEFAFWVSEIGDASCQLGWKAYFDRLYPLSIVADNPKLKWYIDGQPKGPTIKVKIQATVYTKNICTYTVESEMVFYARKSLNIPNIQAVYLSLGPTVIVLNQPVSDNSDNIFTSILASLSLFNEYYRKGGYDPTKEER